jgi:hypothetical protein
MADEKTIDKSKAVPPGNEDKKKRGNARAARQKKLAAIQKKLAALSRNVDKLAAMISMNTKKGGSSKPAGKKPAQKPAARKPGAKTASAKAPGPAKRPKKG